MKSFKDATGQEWLIGVTVDTIKRVRDLANVDLLSILDGKLVEQLTADPILLCNVVYIVCKPDADERGISDEQFGQRMGGDSIDGATSALLEELVNFFPVAKRRVLTAAVEKFRKMEKDLADQIEAKIEALNPPSLNALSGSALASAA